MIDARAVRRRLVPHESPWHLRDDPERRRRLDRARLRKPLPPTRAEWVRGIILGLVAAPILLTAALAPGYLYFKSGLPWPVRLVSVLPMAILPAVVTIFIARRSASRQIARTYTDAGYCASCGYDLTTAPGQDDGCRVCPECGSAWRITGDP